MMSSAGPAAVPDAVVSLAVKIRAARRTYWKMVAHAMTSICPHASSTVSLVVYQNISKAAVPIAFYIRVFGGNVLPCAYISDRLFFLVVIHGAAEESVHYILLMKLYLNIRHDLIVVYIIQITTNTRLARDAVSKMAIRLSQATTEYTPHPLNSREKLPRAKSVYRNDHNSAFPSSKTN